MRSTYVECLGHAGGRAGETSFRFACHVPVRMFRNLSTVTSFVDISPILFAVRRLDELLGLSSCRRGFPPNALARDSIGAIKIHVKLRRGDHGFKYGEPIWFRDTTEPATSSTYVERLGHTVLHM